MEFKIKRKINSLKNVIGNLKVDIRYLENQIFELECDGYYEIAEIKKENLKRLKEMKIEYTNQLNSIAN